MASRTMYTWNGSAWVPRPLYVESAGFTRRPIWAYIGGTYIQARTPASTETAQNLLLYSEVLSNAAWIQFPANRYAITNDQANDMNGQATLDFLDSSGYSDETIYQKVVSNINTNTLYTISFEVYRVYGPTGNIYVTIENSSTSAIILNTSYGGSLTGSVQRLSFEFTTPATLADGILVHIVWHYNEADYIQLMMGRIHLYEGAIGSKSYVTTTSSQVV
jgi:hypothetical protein